MERIDKNEITIDDVEVYNTYDGYATQIDSRECYDEVKAMLDNCCYIDVYSADDEDDREEYEDLVARLDFTDWKPAKVYVTGGCIEERDDDFGPMIFATELVPIR